jgi:hypothetical protein
VVKQLACGRIFECRGEYCGHTYHAKTYFYLKILQYGFQECKMKTFLISLAIGLIAAVIDTVPMIIRKMDKFFIISAFCTWIILGLFIPKINFVSISFINGVIVAILFVLPMSFLIYKLDQKGLPAVIITTIVLGCAVGFFSKMFIK